MSTQILEKNNISFYGGTRKKEGGSSFENLERVHALVASTVSSPSFIIDYGASRQMVSTKETFSSLDDSKGPNILLGDNSETESKGKGSIDFYHGSFNNVFYVPGLASNILSVYQMNHTRSPKKVVSLPIKLKYLILLMVESLLKVLWIIVQESIGSHTSCLSLTPLISSPMPMKQANFGMIRLVIDTINTLHICVKNIWF